ncbi:chemotaxis protein CheA [Magnetospirillum sp. UT-4]|uniref:chemotaxis protein CheA n=1 Tax=Magnetospirillum sp. UT-4 TaxID=2681467 RepID=UPI0013861ED5|nr:chemotaxis protein CheA [Magnetospirillum sp. UT-4]CAA7619599.1 CheA Signal transduction histidine Kinases (STHK) [Magnetospirillum sp. UT-4]
MSTPLLERFVGEARELLQGSASALLVLEKHPGDEAAINEVFRSVHTLKGSAGLFDFPAFTKLVHASEDVLSVVRTGQLPMTSELVDMLLDALDQVSAWVDDIDGTGALRAGADGVSKEMTAALRAVLPADYGATQAGPSAAHAGDLVTLDWLAAIPEVDRLSAFAAAMAGAELQAVEYIPLEDSFFSGEDPFILFRQMPELRSLAIEAAEPWPAMDALDPYRCNLRFRALVAAPSTEVEALFRYVIEQVGMAPVPPHALVTVTGDRNGGPVYGDFVEEARRLVAAADWPALRRAVAALLHLTAPALLLASALRWLDAVLAVPTPDASWVTALIGCIATGDADLHPLAPAPLARPIAAVAAPAATALPERAGLGTVSLTAARILDSQRAILGLPVAPGGYATRLDSVAKTVANILAAEGRRAADAAAWSAAVEAARVQESAAPALDLLDHWLLTDEGTAAAVMQAAGDHGRRRAEAGEHPSPEVKQASRVLKVDQAKIDTLMNLIGELVVSKNSLPFLAKRAEQVHGSREMSREIKDLHAVIERLAQEMQGAIMAVRMLPVSEVFDRFPRLVRDVARKLGKRIDLVIEGADTAADKNIIEALGDPLLHIVRNAIDHGIEPPEDRDAAGKPSQATVLLRAFQESDQVVIEVVDDGRGIDPAKIKASAVAKGVLDEERAARLTDQEAVNLVFMPGFSTAAQVSDLSGRGVGMDVVVTGVEKTGGSVSITSVTGEGTTVRLSLPLSMAVTRVMVVEAGGGMLFGIPMDHIAETVRVHRDAVRRFKQSEAFVLRDAIVPLIRLDRLMGVPTSVWIGDGSEEDAVLVVRIGGNMVGLVVDNFREGMDIILKPFDGILANIRGYSGSALLGDGRVLLVLNLKELL